MAAAQVAGGSIEQLSEVPTLELAEGEGTLSQHYGSGTEIFLG